MFECSLEELFDSLLVLFLGVPSDLSTNASLLTCHACRTLTGQVEHGGVLDAQLVCGRFVFLDELRSRAVPHICPDGDPIERVVLYRFKVHVRLATLLVPGIDLMALVLLDALVDRISDPVGFEHATALFCIAAVAATFVVWVVDVSVALIHILPARLV